MDYISLLCCLVAFLLYYNTLDAGFVYDDRRAILSNPDLLPSTPWQRLLQDDFWGTPLSDSGSHGSYRPLCVLSFRLNYLLGGFQPWGYHLVNVLLHCLATVLLVRVSRHVLPRTRSSIGSAAAGLLFASHPIHTEAVAGVVGRADLAACNLYLLSFLAYITHIKYRDASHCDACTTSNNRESCNAPSAPQHANVNVRELFRSGTYRCSHDISTYLLNNVGHWNGNCTTPTSRQQANVGGGGGGRELARFSEHKVGAVKRMKAAADVEEVIACCWLKSFKSWASLALCVLLSGAAMLSKETGITVLGLCVLFDFLHSPNVNKKQWRSGLVVTTAAAIMLIARLHGPTPQFSTADNPTAKEPSILARFLTFLYLPVLNVGLLLFPDSLSFDWGMDAVPRIRRISDARNVYSVLFYAGVALVVRYSVSVLCKYGSLPKTPKLERRGRQSSYPCMICVRDVPELHSTACRTSNNNNSPFAACSCWRTSPSTGKQRKSHVEQEATSCACTLLISLALLTFPFLPATNLFFYVGFVVAERVLYLPSAGLCLLLGLGASRLWGNRKFRLPVAACLCVTLLAFSARTMLRNRDWTNEESLYRSAIPINPPKAYGNLGSVLSSQGRITEAEWAYRKALEYRPNMADVHYNLGVLLQGKQQLKDAIESFQRAIHFRPSLALAYVNLGAALIAAGRCQEAVTVLRQGARVDGAGLKDRREHDAARVSALLQLGALYSDQGRLQRALATYREAAHSLPDHYPPQSVFNVLGETLARLQQNEEAERWYQAALNAQPDHVPAHITYGKLLAKNVSRLAEAEQWFRRAQRLAPDDPSVYHHYGEFLASRGRHKEAAGLYEKAAELRPKDYELSVAAATAMRQATRHVDAERWYRRAVLLKPSDARGHTNLGAILHLNGKYREAADSYREALRLQPNDVTTLTNLHRLHTVMT